MMKTCCWLIACMLSFCGCREPKEYAIQNELKPTTFGELISMSAEDVERVDIGRLNLICAAEALKPETFDIGHCLKKLQISRSPKLPAAKAT